LGKSRDLDAGDGDITVYYDSDKLDEYIEDFLEEDYIEEFSTEEAARNQLVKDFFNEECVYNSFTDYCSSQWGVSMEKNVCAIAVAIAKLNHITMGELFNKHQG
jgi:hypothetical protein